MQVKSVLQLVVYNRNNGWTGAAYICTIGAKLIACAEDRVQPWNKLRAVRLMQAVLYSHAEVF